MSIKHYIIFIVGFCIIFTWGYYYPLDRLFAEYSQIKAILVSIIGIVIVGYAQYCKVSGADERLRSEERERHIAKIEEKLGINFENCKILMIADDKNVWTQTFLEKKFDVNIVCTEQLNNIADQEYDVIINSQNRSLLYWDQHTKLLDRYVGQLKKNGYLLLAIEKGMSQEQYTKSLENHFHQIDFIYDWDNSDLVICKKVSI